MAVSSAGSVGPVCTVSGRPTNQSGGSMLNRSCTVTIRSTEGTRGAQRGRRGGSGRLYRRRMRTELPAERVHRRLGAQPSAEAQSDDGDDADNDPNSLLPRWV